MARFDNIADWLGWINLLHVKNMDLSLERVIEVGKRLDVLNPSSVIITVGGTNGKGSCVAGLEAIYLAMGYRTGAFTSPKLFRHNEQIRIQGQDTPDEEFCDAFDKIDQARGDITLTPFEFTSLASFLIFKKHHLDVWILEVGLGGRFDAVNAINADIALVTSISLDHIDWLGETREKISYEKAGIFRSKKPAICGDFDPPLPLIDYAKEIGALLYCQGREFGFKKNGKTWTWWSLQQRLEQLPMPALALQNMATVLMAVEANSLKLPVSEAAIKEALSTVKLTGRIQVFPGKVTQIFDVSHNPASAEFLAVWLRENQCKGKTRAVFSMLADKDIATTIEVVKEMIDEWHIASLAIDRGATLEQMLTGFEKNHVQEVSTYNEIAQAYEAVKKQSKHGDRMVIFGSFHTVADVRVG